MNELSDASWESAVLSPVLCKLQNTKMKRQGLALCLSEAYMGVHGCQWSPSLLAELPMSSFLNTRKC